MKLSVIVLTIPQRAAKFGMLMRALEAQLTPECEVVVVRGKGTISSKRNRGVQRSRGEYICFVDDDDMVSLDYIESLLPVLDGEVQHVGFRVQRYADGVKDKPTIHDPTKYSYWWEDEKGYYRDISHLNPTLRSLVGTFRQGYGEDARWVEDMRGSISRTTFIDKVLYHYFFNSGDTSWKKVVARRKRG